MSCHVEVDNGSSIVNEYDEDEQDFEPNGVHREEVDRSELRNMIIQEGPPRLGGRFPTSDLVLGHRGFGNLDAQLCAARKIRPSGCSKPGFVRRGFGNASFL